MNDVKITSNIHIHETDIGTPVLSTRGILVPIISPRLHTLFTGQYIELVTNTYLNACDKEFDIPADVTYYLFLRKEHGALTIDIYGVITTANGHADMTISDLVFSDGTINIILERIRHSDIIRGNKTAQMWYKQYEKDSKKII